MTDTYALLEASRSPRRSRLRSREVAYEAIKHAILSGQIPPHERLVEERLAEALQISRTPVREALAILEHEGLLESIPYKGLAVKPVTIDEFLHMYEALGVIEAALARDAALNASPADLRQMEAALAAAEAAIPSNVPAHLTACREFQSVLGASGGGVFLTRMLMSIEERSDMYLINSGRPLPEEKMLASVNDRRKILDQVRAGNPDGAEDAALSHASAIRSRWREHYHDFHPS